MSKSRVPPFFTQVVLENTKLRDEGVGYTSQKKSRVRFTLEEDKHLVQTWLKISRDATDGVDQNADSFWSRIKDNYNENRRCRIRERGMVQLKSRWHKLNDIVQKFAWCYKQAARRKKNGSSESDIMANARVIFNQDEGKQFNLEYAWRWLKDEPKWITESFESSSKKRKNFASGAYSSSSNPSTPTSCEYDPASPTLVQPIGKAAKRNVEAKPNETSSSNVVGVLQEAVKSKMTIMAEFMRVKDEENNVEKEKVKLEKEKLKFNEMQILLTDTSKMTERQLRDHEILCSMIREKYGMI